MLERIPISYFFAKRSSWALVSRKGGQAGHAVGQEVRARRLEVPAQLRGHAHGGAAQDLGVQLVRAALDLALDLDEARDQHVAVDREAVAVGLLLEGVVDAGLPVDQGAVAVEGDELDVFGKCHSVVSIGSAPPGAAAQHPIYPRMDLLEYQGKQLFAKHGVPVPDGTPRGDRRGGGRGRRGARLSGRDQGAGPDRRPRQGRRDQARRGPRRGRAARRGDPRDGHPRLHRPRGLGREGQRDRRGVLRGDRVRPLGQEADGDAVAHGRHGRRGGRRDGPRGHAHAARGPADRLPGLPRPPARLRGRASPRT